MSWSFLALFGDPAMLLVPALGLAVITVSVFALGAPGRPEVLVPAFAAPPADAFTDAGVAGLVERSTAATWVVRAVLAMLRALVFGVVVALAIARTSGRIPSLGEAARRVARRLPVLAALAALAMGFAYAIAGGPIEPGREAGVAGTALVAGMLFAPGAFIAAVADGRGILGSLRRSGRWVTRRPLGHLGLVAGYSAAFGGTIRLALFGEVARPRALPVSLYAFVATWVTMLFTLALARRYALLYSDEVLAPERAARLAGRRAKGLDRIARRSGRTQNEAGRPKTKTPSATRQNGSQRGAGPRRSGSSKAGPAENKTR